MAVIQIDTTFWKEFFALYKSLPETWLIKSEIYKNKIRKTRAYEQLVEKLKTVEPTATMETVKRKINNFRSCYRRELKKVRQSKRTALCDEDVYKPALWYFEELSFLREQEVDDEFAIAMEQTREGPDIDWSNNATLMLIEQWKRYPFLYELNRRKDSNELVRQHALRKIANKLKFFYANITPFDVKKRLNNLRAEYTSELSKRRKSNKTGADMDYETPYWFPKLEFLRDYVKIKKVEPKLPAIISECSESSCDDLDSCDRRDLNLSDSEEIEQVFLPISEETNCEEAPYSESAPKRMKTDTSQKDVLMKQVTNVLQKISSTPPSTVTTTIYEYPPDVEAFGNLMKSEFHKITDEELRDEAQHLILNIFYEIKKKQRNLNKQMSI